MNKAVLVALLALQFALFGSEVRVDKTADGFRLLRDGQPYFIKGAGGESHLDTLVQCGGNSIRTCSTNGLDKTLDNAQKAGLTVCAGIWLAPDGRGYFNYDNPKNVADQIGQVKKDVAKYKDHPALLIWGVGNEIEDKGEKEVIWRGIDEAAKAVKEVDPNHPTMCVFAELSKRKFAAFQKWCPHVDILGVNCYGGAFSIGKRVKEYGTTRPLIVTEFGPLGPWEVGKSKWGAPFENTSTQKADRYVLSYNASIKDNPLCLGSYAFVWGHKFENSSTWFGMFLKSGEALGVVDQMAAAWGGTPPVPLAPHIAKFECSAHNKELAPGTEIVCSVALKDGDKKEGLTARWELRNDAKGAKHEGLLATQPAGLADANGLSIKFNAPDVPSAYRLYVTVLDGKGRAATANSVFLIKK